MSDPIDLAPEDDWEDENPEQVATQKREEPELSDRAIAYLAQIKALQENLQQELIKVQRLEMAIRGFRHALQEELEKGP